MMEQEVIRLLQTYYQYTGKHATEVHASPLDVTRLVSEVNLSRRFRPEGRSSETVVIVAGVPVVKDDQCPIGTLFIPGMVR